MLPRGFLGTDADLLIDVIIVALPVVVGVMAFAWRAARRKQWTLHRNVQTVLAAVLTVVVGALEIDLHLLGGVEAMVSDERGVSDLARRVLQVHLLFASSTAVVWALLVGGSWWRFPSPPRPGAFSRFHRFWGRVALFLMTGTAVTGGCFYAALFVV